MKVNGKSYLSVWRENQCVKIVDQTQLPHQFQISKLSTLLEIAEAISQMQVRGAPLIGVTAAYGLAISMSQKPTRKNLFASINLLSNTRPTAVNLKWALTRMKTKLESVKNSELEEIAWQEADQIAKEDIGQNINIGKHGLKIIKDIAQKKERVQILTHCNAGWLATVDYGTALAPIYLAHEAGINLHVWVDETRPRNQGHLTAWELTNHGVPATLIADNAGGHLMQMDKVDLVLVGADRVSARGDVCNKIGTYLKALSAKDNQVPFYAAVPTPTIDWTITNPAKQIPIEERKQEELLYVTGLDNDGKIKRVSIGEKNLEASNPAFDITPFDLITGIITERGIVSPVDTHSMSQINKNPNGS